MEPHGGLECKRMEGRWEVGSGQENACSSEHDAKEALGMSILLRRIRARERLMDLSGGEELSKMMRHECTALVRSHDQWLERAMKAHERADFCSKCL